MLQINSVIFRIIAVIIILIILSTFIACQPSATTIAVTETRTTTIPVKTTTTETAVITTTKTNTATTTVSAIETTTVTITVSPGETSTTTTVPTTTTATTTAAPASFTGSFSGTWTGQDETGEPASGTFSVTIDEYGNVDGMFKGSYAAVCTGAIDSFGNLFFLGNALVNGVRMNIVWVGTLSRNGKTISGDGKWSCFSAAGTFSGTGTATE